MLTTSAYEHCSRSITSVPDSCYDTSESHFEPPLLDGICRRKLENAHHSEGELLSLRLVLTTIGDPKF